MEQVLDKQSPLFFKIKHCPVSSTKPSSTRNISINTNSYQRASYPVLHTVVSESEPIANKNLHKILNSEFHN